MGCTSLISGYSLESYKAATSLKARALALVDRSGGVYNKYEQQAETLMIDANAAYEFAKGIPNNEISSKQWRLLIDPERNLLGGFIKKWRLKGKTGSFYRKAKRKQIAQSFDYIICLEINKKSTKLCSMLSSRESGVIYELG